MTNAWIVALALQPESAPAEPVALEWTAPAGCPDRESMLTRVDALLPAEPSADAAPVRAHGTIVADAAGHTLVLDLDGAHASGRREIAASDCHELADAAALLLALAIDPAAGGPPRELPPPPPPKPVPIAPPPVEVRRAEPPAPAREITHVVVRPELGLSLAAPAPAGFHAGAAIGLARRRWRVELAGRHHLAARGALDAIATGAAVLASLTTVSARACASWQWRTLGLHGCAGIVAGAMIGRGTGLPAARRSVEPYLAGSLAVALAWRFHERLGLWFEAAATPSIVRPGFAVASTGGPRRVYRAPILAGTVGGGLEIRLR